MERIPVYGRFHSRCPFWGLAMKVAVWAESLEFVGAVLIAEGGEELGTVKWSPAGFEWEADSKRGTRPTRREAEIVVLRIIRNKLRLNNGSFSGIHDHDAGYEAPEKEPEHDF